MTDEQITRFLAALIPAHDAGMAALQTWGPQAQMAVATEEAGELVSALARHARGRVGVEAVAEEVADVLLTAMQVAQVYGVEEVIDALTAKTARLDRRVRGEE